MKYLLGFSLLLIISDLGCDAACYGEYVQPGVQGCFIEGKLRPFGSTTRTKNCMSCSCSSSGSKCCSLYVTPVKYDRKNCRTFLDYKACETRVVRKDDPTVECEVQAAVGR
ncbi:beta-microseminoprotein-like [Lissotriton helveticus]